MHQFKRLLKPLAVTTMLGAGGYYAYDWYKVNLQMERLQNQLKGEQQQKVQVMEKLDSDIPKLLEHQQQEQYHTLHEKEDLQLQKEESFETHSHEQKLPQKQQTHQQRPPQKPSEQQETKTQQQSQKEQQSPQQQQHHPQKIQENAPNQPIQQLPEQKQTQKQPVISQSAKDIISDSQAQAQESVDKVPKTEQKSQQLTQKKQTQTQTHVPIDLKTLNKLNQLPLLPLTGAQKLKTAIVVADMGFTEQFQSKLLETVKNLKLIPKHEDIQIYRMNLMNEQEIKQMQKTYGHKIKDETIFLIKNQLDQSFVDINFDMYMQYPTLINTYLSKLNLYGKQREKEYLTKLQKMGSNESYLMFVYDDKEPQEKRAKALLAAKYIEMELALHHLDHVVKVLAVESQLAKDSGVVPEDKIRSKSLHIIRKHNEFTHTQPNLHLKFDDQTSPYHLLADIGFHNKRGQVAIQSYLSKIQTFNSLSITTPYILSVTIDKNRITTDNYKKLMDTFRVIKRRNQYPQVGIALKFAEVGYLGNDQAENNQFCIKMANVAELENQSSLHEIQNIQDAQSLGITEQNWLMSSNQYLYPHQAVSEELINDFVEKTLSGETPQYYRSDKPSTIQNVHKIVASNFDKQILNNNFDHFVFEYSDHCPSCKLISPLIGYVNDVLGAIPVQERMLFTLSKGFDIHVMNCQKNRVKGQVYSPYTPNMSYYKNEWKHSGPVKIGLETIKYQGLVGLYDFCLITKILKTIDGKKFDQAINNAKMWNPAEFVL